MLLLAPELLSIALCAGSVGSELGPFGTTDGVNVTKQYGVMRASAASVGDVAVWCVTGAGTLIWRASFASAQVLTNVRRASLLVLKMRWLHGTNGIPAPTGRFWRSRSCIEVGTRTAA